MHNAVMCTLSLYDVIGITRHLYIKLESFSDSVFSWRQYIKQIHNGNAAEYLF